MAEITVQELSDNADDLAHRASPGEEFVITRDGTPIGMLVSATSTPPRRPTPSSESDPTP